MQKKFTEIEQNTWVSWLRCTQRVMEEVEQSLKNSGFPPLAWYDALLELDCAREGKLRLSELAEKMLLKKFNITRLIDRMEAEGLVERESCEADARGAYAAITEKGKKLRRSMWPTYRDAVYKSFLSKMTDKEISSLSNMLKIIGN